MNITLTPIPDKEAAELLGVSYGAIRQAVARGDLTRVPMAGRVQHVAKEQVMLFQCKKMLRSSLNSEERKTWEDIEAAILCKQKVPSSDEEQKNERSHQGVPFSLEEKRIQLELDKIRHLQTIEENRKRELEKMYC